MEDWVSWEGVWRKWICYLGDVLHCEAGVDRAVKATVVKAWKELREMASLLTNKSIQEAVFVRDVPDRLCCMEMKYRQWQGKWKTYLKVVIEEYLPDLPYPCVKFIFDTLYVNIKLHLQWHMWPSTSKPGISHVSSNVMFRLFLIVLKIKFLLVQKL